MPRSGTVDSCRTIRTLSASRLLTESDINCHLSYSGGTPITLTIPSGLLNFENEVEVAQLGSGVVTITPDIGVTLNGTSSSIVLTANSRVSLKAYSGTTIGVFGLSGGGGSLTYPIAVNQGGTGATDAATARSNLGVINKNDSNDDLVWEASDHFFYAAIATSNTPIGPLGFLGNVSGAQITSMTGTAANPGLMSISTSTAATNHGIFRTANKSILFGAAYYRLKMVVQIPVLPGAGNEFYVNLGFIDTTAGNGNPTNCARFTCSQNNPNWQVFTISASTPTTSNTGVAVNTSFNTFEVEVNKGATEVNYYINGAVVATHTTNIPNVTGREVGICLSIAKTVGTTARNLNVDFVKLRMDFR